MNVSVCTASLPERHEMLVANLDSVARQTYPVIHRFAVDHERQDAPAVYNRLLEKVDTEWVTFLDDDDLMDPTHIETMVRSVKDDDAVDVVYTRPRVIGHGFNLYHRPFSPQLLDELSIVPITALARATAVRGAGGFLDEKFYDWNLWKRISANGGRFRALDATTWSYVRHGLGNRSYGEVGS